MCFAGSYILHGDPVSDQYGCGGGRGGEGEEGEREREKTDKVECCGFRGTVKSR